jgi:hypothetical protein
MLSLGLTRCETRNCAVAVGLSTIGFLAHVFSPVPVHALLVVRPGFATAFADRGCRATALDQ